MERILLAFCPLCGERFRKEKIEERTSHECLELGNYPESQSRAGQEGQNI